MVLVWDEFLKIIKEEAGSQIVETWFKSVGLDDWNPALNTVTLRAPNQFVSSWIQDHYATLIKTHLGRLLHVNDVRLFFVTSGCENIRDRTIIPASVILSTPHNNKTMGSGESTSLVSQRVQLPEKKTKEKPGPNIQGHYVFENFIVGPSNSLAHAAGVAICENLGKIYNPLFIYGGTGLGKTHLMHAIGNVVRKKHPMLAIRYETTDRFINEFINCIRFDKFDQFRNKYQKLDLFLLDDVQFLSQKEQTQEAFFHIFNTIYEQQRQIVISSDTFPQEITGLQSRLKSRMEWGLVADIQMPDLETKIAILKKKAELQNVILNDDVAEFIASRVLSNIRELEGALIRVGAFASLTSHPITIELARRVLLNLQEQRREDLLLETVLRVVARHYGISIIDIRSKKRHKDIAYVRQVALFLMKKLTFFSLQAIGESIGGRDHSTVIHAVAKIEQLLAQDRAFEQKLRLIEREILS